MIYIIQVEIMAQEKGSGSSVWFFMGAYHSYDICLVFKFYPFF